MTFGSDNLIIDINMNGLPIPWASKVKYLGVCFLCNSGKTDLTDTIRDSFPVMQTTWQGRSTGAAVSGYQTC